MKQLFFLLLRIRELHARCAGKLAQAQICNQTWRQITEIETQKTFYACHLSISKG